MIEASQVGRTFAGGRSGEGVAALRDVDLVVGPGEFVGIAGPSGSGKTTLLHLLAAIDTPTRGRVLLDGVDVASLSRGARADLRLRRVGLVFAEHNLSPALTAAENVDLPLALAGLPPDERRRRVADALQRLGVPHLAHRPAASLSSGEQQRVAVARAVAGRPAVLVADEPTAHLDSAAADALVDLMQERVRDQGMAAVVASHDPAVLARTDRVVSLRDGRLAEPVT